MIYSYDRPKKSELKWRDDEAKSKKNKSPLRGFDLLEFNYVGTHDYFHNRVDDIVLKVSLSSYVC